MPISVLVSCFRCPRILQMIGLNGLSFMIIISSRCVPAHRSSQHSPRLTIIDSASQELISCECNVTLYQKSFSLVYMVKLIEREREKN
jgi:hypothetical protein